MTKHTKPEELKKLDAELMDLVPVVEPDPWEDPESFDALKSAVFAELNPETVYERAVATEIFACIWDAFRSRVLAKDLRVACYRKSALQLVLMEGFQALPDKGALDAVGALLGADKSARAAAKKKLKQMGITEADIVAKAYIDHFHETEALARRPFRFDERRRALMKEYAELKARREQAAIEDAEVLVPDGD